MVFFIGRSQIFILHLPGFLKHVVHFFLAFLNVCAILNKSLVCKYKTLVTFHEIWYFITELSRPAWQKDLRDITFPIIQAMEEAKKDETVV